MILPPAFKIISGIAFLALGLCYLYRPDIMERVNRVIKDTLLNDSYVALRHKKWGLFLVLAGALLICMGVIRLNG